MLGASFSYWLYLSVAMVSGASWVVSGALASVVGWVVALSTVFGGVLSVASFVVGVSRVVSVVLFVGGKGDVAAWAGVAAYCVSCTLVGVGCTGATTGACDGAVVGGTLRAFVAF